MIRVAIVGGGPKALFALLALNDLLTPSSGSALEIDVFDPCLPGAGSVWRQAQPPALRMNVNAAMVDASSTLRRETLADWLKRLHPTLDNADYPPRAVVGKYLREHYELLTSHGSFDIKHIAAPVEQIESVDGRWLLSGFFGSHYYDQVLLATGHGLATAKAVTEVPSAVNPHPLIGDYSALESLGDVSKRSVWIRGAALTAFDLTLLLTEGSGGSWSFPTAEASAALPVYQKCGAEPVSIVMTSRSGLPMESKIPAVPQSVVAALLPHKLALEGWGESVSEDTPTDEHHFNELWRILLRAARDCGAAVDVETSALALWRVALTGTADAKYTLSADSAPTRGPLEKAHVGPKVTDAVVGLPAADETLGGRGVSSAWMLARAWSGLYAELVAAMDRRGRTEHQRTMFERVARNLERFAFGPPPLTARKLLALAECGLLSHETAALQPPQDAVVLNAVTPPPGVVGASGTASHGLYQGLLDAGHVMVRDGERGLLTRRDGSCVAANGLVSEGLAAIGRPTEGPTLGHDTLNRELHTDYKMWALRIAELAGEHASRTPQGKDPSEDDEDM